MCENRPVIKTVPIPSPAPPAAPKSLMDINTEMHCAPSNQFILA